jgi:hypothetical protein
LRFNTGTTQVVTDDTYSALDVEGTIRHKVAAEPCEYCVVLDVRNERGEQVVRQVVGVGVLQAGESRRLHVAVDMLPVRARTATPASAKQAPATVAAVPQTGAAAAPPASPQAAARSYLKPPVPGQPTAKPSPSQSGLFKNFRKP